jgi:hypothetical protein
VLILSDLYIDPFIDPLGNPVFYVNTADPIQCNAKFQYFDTCDTRLVICVATKPIEEGEEIYAPYGMG